jgi:hypothetical protein
MPKGIFDIGAHHMETHILQYSYAPDNLAVRLLDVSQASHRSAPQMVGSEGLTHNFTTSPIVEGQMTGKRKLADTNPKSALELIAAVGFAGAW